MIQLRIAASDLRDLREELLRDDVERCAVLFASRSQLQNGEARLLVREISFPEESAYATHGPVHAELRPEFVAKVAKQARLAGWSLVFVHSHPPDAGATFSAVDDRGERVLQDFLVGRDQPGPHAAMVINKNGLCARILGVGEAMEIVSIGERLVTEYDPGEAGKPPSELFDRQIRAFGKAGQQRLQQLRVAIVGLGGTGSIVAQQLVHLGIRDFVLIDPDHLDLTNLNRIVAASEKDVGTAKVEVAARYLKAFSREVAVESIQNDVVRTVVARHLTSCDVIFGCTDSHGSRSIIQQAAYQYLIPCIDLGSTIVAKSGQVTGIFGRVQALGPDLPCLWCTGLLNSEEVRRDMMSEVERRVDPYIPGVREPAPSVISINGTVVSLAINMLLGLVTDVPIDARYLLYNATTSTLRPVRGKRVSDCFICSRSGAFGRGDMQALFGRQD